MKVWLIFKTKGLLDLEDFLPDSRLGAWTVGKVPSPMVGSFPGFTVQVSPLVPSVPSNDSSHTNLSISTFLISHRLYPESRRPPSALHLSCSSQLWPYLPFSSLGSPPTPQPIASKGLASCCCKFSGPINVSWVTACSPLGRACYCCCPRMINTTTLLRIIAVWSGFINKGGFDCA